MCYSLLVDKLINKLGIFPPQCFDYGFIFHSIPSADVNEKWFLKTIEGGNLVRSEAVRLHHTLISFRFNEAGCLS